MGGKVASGSPRNNTGGIGGAAFLGGNGGGIANSDGAMDVENSTITRNEARPSTLPTPLGQGGGVYNTTTIGNPKTSQLTNRTVAYNVGEVGSQLYASIFNSGLLVANTLIVGEPGRDPNCSASTPGGLGGNVSSDNSIYNSKSAELGDHVGVSTSGLAADLADNGGETLTLSIPEDSPVVGEGLAIHCPATDQRGVDRPLPCAVGAFEPVVVTPLACGEASEVPGNLRAGITEPRVITASDALIVLSASVGIAECPLCVFDVKDSGGGLPRPTPCCWCATPSANRWHSDVRRARERGVAEAA